MPAIEKRLAEQLVDLRHQQHLGHDYAPISDLIDAVQFHLDREMELRAKVAEVLEP